MDGSGGRLRRLRDQPASLITPDPTPVLSGGPESVGPPCRAGTSSPIWTPDYVWVDDNSVCRSRALSRRRRAGRRLRPLEQFNSPGARPSDPGAPRRPLSPYASPPQPCTMLVSDGRTSCRRSFRGAVEGREFLDWLLPREVISASGRDARNGRPLRASTARNMAAWSARRRGD